MFCSNCGKEVTGNFCSYCGAKLLEDNTEAQSNNNECVTEDIYIDINETRINISEMVSTYGNNKIKAIKYLRDITGIGLKEAKEIIDNAYEKIYMIEPKKGFWESVKEQSKLQMQRDMEKKQQENERVKRLEAEGIAYCPKCHSTSLSAQKKGFGIGKAVVGAALTGGIGLVAGNIGSKKVRVTCLKCGHQFWAGKK